jgi:hypothetical protein
MGFIGVLASVALILLILVDAFETTVLPRRVTHRFRFSRFFYVNTWKFWRVLASWFPAGEWREAVLGFFGPLSLLGLIAIWAFGLILGFAVLDWSLEMPVRVPQEEPTFWTYLYMSGTTFFTLGYGDITPTTTLGRALAVAEAGLGFGFLAVIVSYLPVISQIFSRREVLIALLDARAGSPPSAAVFLHRLAKSRDMQAIDSFLAEWERWSAELLESHLSFPMLAMYRSQHSNQSWISALTAVLDTSAFLIVAVKEHNPYQAQLTFAMARHAVVDLALIYKTPPISPELDRLPEGQLQRLRELLREAGVLLHEGPAVDAKLADLRGMYEAFVNALSQRFLFALPAFVPETDIADNWQRSAWMKRAPDIESLPIAATGDGHFE